MKYFFEDLSRWFLDNKREFPWRNNRTFYRVWVSEVMLQQTRADVVVSYFEKWMDKFPDIQSLAKAPLTEVIKCWEGLGYYSRARNLHSGAKEIVKAYGDNFPTTEDELREIKGVGPYTIGAILSFAYQKKALAIDGNVLRVLSRFFMIEEAIEKTATRKKIELLLEKHHPQEKSWIVNEALIELGALVCQKAPKCPLCPLRKKCLAYLGNKESMLPIREKKISYIKEKRMVILLESNDHFLVKKNEKDVMKDLYEFPFISLESFSSLSKTFLEDFVRKTFGVEASFLSKLSSQSHTYTKYRIELLPFLFSVSEKKESLGYSWITKENLKDLPFSSGHRKIKERFI